MATLHELLTRQPPDPDAAAALANALQASYTQNIPGVNAALAPYCPGFAFTISWGPTPLQTYTIWCCGDLVILLFHGLQTPDDFIGTFLGSSQTPCVNVPGHIMSFTDDVLSQGFTAIDNGLQIAADHLGVSSFHLIVAGHSHGGNLALGYFTQHPGPLPPTIADSFIFTFAAPRALSPAAADALTVPHTRIENADDLIPLTPPPNWFFPWPFFPVGTRDALTYLHHGTGYTLTAQGQLAGQAPDGPQNQQGVLSFLAQVPPIAFDPAPHGLPSYVNRLVLGSLPPQIFGQVPGVFPFLLPEVVTMSTYKITYFFGQGPYGWSESFFCDQPNAVAAGLNAADTTLVTARRNLLGHTAAPEDYQPILTAVRAANVSKANDIYVKVFAPQATSALGSVVADIPNTCILLTFRGTVAGDIYVRKQYLRGVPDDTVDHGGRYTPTPLFTGALNFWFSQLQNRGLQAYLANKQSPKIRNNDIAQIGADVVVTTSVPHGLAVNDKVNITRVKPGNAFGGRFFVSAVTGNTYTLTKETLFATPTKFGFTQKLEFILVPFSAMAPDKATHRITGRPSGGPVGRRKRRLHA